MPNSAQTIAATATKINGAMRQNTQKQRGRLTLSLPVAATAAVFTGDTAAVTTSTGLPLYPGEERTYEGAAARKDYWAIVAAATQVLRVEESE